MHREDSHLKTKSSKLENILLRIEKFCDKLPQPAILFMWLFIITAVLSLIFNFFNVTFINPANMAEVHVKNFFSNLNFLKIFYYLNYFHFFYYN